MFVPFLIMAGAIFIVGPIHHGGADAIKEKGFKQAFVDGVKSGDMSKAHWNE